MTIQYYFMYSISYQMLTQCYIKNFVFVFQASKRELSVSVSNAIGFRTGKNNKSLNINATNSSGTFIKTNNGATYG